MTPQPAASGTQPPVSQVSSPPASPICVVCKKSIPSGALKCTECNSYQGWRRHLEFSSLALSLLVALVSVSGIVIPALVKALQRPVSHVQARFISVQPVEVHPLPYTIGKLRYVLPVLVLVTNSGDRPALLKEGLIRVRGAGQDSESRPVQIELFQNDRHSVAVLPLKLDPGAFSPLRLLVEMKPSTDLPEDWNRSEVRSSNVVEKQVTIGGSIELSGLNSEAANEKVMVDIPDQPRSLAVPVRYHKLFENWRRLVETSSTVQGSSSKNRM